jgi:hypothetical protein
MRIVTTERILLLLFFSYLLCIIPVVKSESNLIQYGIPYATRPYIVFPSNTTYKSQISSLNVSFHAQIWDNYNYSMTYSLDEQEKTALHLTQHYFGMFNQDESYIDGSVTLPELSNGSHNAKVFLTLTQETWHKTGSQIHTYLDVQTVYFTTKVTVLPTPSHTPTPSPTQLPTINTGSELSQAKPFPVVTVAAVLVIVALVAVAGLLVYLKSKRTSSNQFKLKA